MRLGANLVCYSLSSLSSSTMMMMIRMTNYSLLYILIIVHKSNSCPELGSENKKKPTEIIKETAPSLKRKRQSDDETVEENKMNEKDGVCHLSQGRGHGAQGVPKLVIRRIKSQGQ